MKRIFLILWGGAGESGGGVCFKEGFKSVGTIYFVPAVSITKICFDLHDWIICRILSCSVRLSNMKDWAIK